MPQRTPSTFHTCGLVIWQAEKPLIIHDVQLDSSDPWMGHANHAMRLELPWESAGRRNMIHAFSPDVGSMLYTYPCARDADIVFQQMREAIERDAISPGIGTQYDLSGFFRLGEPWQFSAHTSRIVARDRLPPPFSGRSIPIVHGVHVFTSPYLLSRHESVYFGNGEGFMEILEILDPPKPGSPFVAYLHIVEVGYAFMECSTLLEAQQQRDIARSSRYSLHMLEHAGWTVLAKDDVPWFYDDPVREAFEQSKQSVKTAHTDAN